eukprot:scaffold2016_cov268-Chaetoceros_neogracile.AAC.9
MDRSPSSSLHQATSLEIKLYQGIETDRPPDPTPSNFNIEDTTNNNEKTESPYPETFEKTYIP